ncbi:hypothetical protein DPMN_165095 [Dreissena polymorpha]|uniref:Uncharacterized protein n=1 Tax=Dreissena polymorpha TaxID=45954 RepID=A0A9D4EW69_DREPO|nr:hypothetical protein DPMN_165095 [Dreissena polymorpha]
MVQFVVALFLAGLYYKAVDNSELEVDPLVLIFWDLSSQKIVQGSQTRDKVQVFLPVS